MKLYLAGKVPKGAAHGTPDWRHAFVDQLVDLDLELLTPEDATLDESLPLTIVGHDCFQIAAADVVVVNAMEKLGVGSAQEMLIAKYFRKPVITLLPRGTHHRRRDLVMNGRVIEDWIHPFIAATSDVIVETQAELSALLAAPVLPAAAGIEIIDRAIAEYCAWRDRASGGK